MVTTGELTDIQLSGLLRAGDTAAFKVIYQRYWDKLLVVAARRLNSVDEAEEAIQDIFLNLWKRRETFNLKVGFDNYFAVAVKFEVINRLAKRARESQRNLAFAENNTKHHDPVTVAFDVEMLQKQLEHTISSFPPKCQLVFRMSREREYTNKKIALELGISEKAVEKQITQALKKLKTRFGALFNLMILFI